MPPSTTSPPSTARVKKPRSRIACKRCHDRRVKCDVSTIGTPCSGCISANLDSQCQYLDSKRSRGDNGRFSCRDSATITPRNHSTPRDSGTDGTEARDHSVPRPRSASQTGTVSADADEADVWSKVVSHDTATPTEGRRVMYVGEPWTLAYVMQWKGRGGQAPDDASTAGLADSPTPVHVSVPVDNSASPAAQQHATYAAITSAAKSDLPAEIQQALVDSYFARDYVLYPIVDQRSFRTAFRNGAVSPCLLFSVFYAGALHAPDPVIYRAGFDSRQACLLSLYRRAKVAFCQCDDDGVIDQLSYIQAAFLLHNMWQSPNATMDPWTWLGLATRMAQNIGMHRSTKHSALPASEKRLWKRMWWCLHMRDRQIASALGKPLMINDQDCDVEPLTLDDFEIGDSEEMRHFVIQQARLSILFGSVISSLYTIAPREPSHKDQDRTAVMQRLAEWKAELPPFFRCPNHRALDGVPFSGLLLEALYNCLLLLIHRSRHQVVARSPMTQATAWKTTFDAAVDAATAITRVTETIMNHGSLTDCPLFFTSAIFGAMTIHAIRGQEAEPQLSLCMIAMRPLSTMYHAAGWIRNMFQKLNEKRATSSARPTRPSSPTHDSSGRSSGLAATDGASSVPIHPSSAPNVPVDEGSMMDIGMRPSHSAWLQFEAWPSAPGNINAFGLMSRNVGGLMDYSMMPDGTYGGMDPHLAEYWHDILSTENGANGHT